jgi:multicomponent Na+:H+ antiporter subunit F
MSTDPAAELVVVDAVLVVLALAFTLAMGRIVRGPTRADRVVAADLAFFLLVGVVALVGARADAPAYLDVVLVVAVVGFLSTVALSRVVRR